MKRFSYYWARILTQITGMVFLLQFIFRVAGITTPKPGFEWVIYACAAAFAASLLYTLALIVLNARLRHNSER